MNSTEHDRLQGDVGAYLLGALPDSEAERFRAHLAGCELCQEEALRLRAAVEALPRTVPQVEPPPSLKASLMETVRTDAAARSAPSPARDRRPRWSWPRVRVPAFAAAAALAAGLAIGIAVSGLGDDEADPRTVVAEVDSNRLGAARGALLVPDGESGRAVLRMTGLPPAGRGRVYEVWVSRDGHTQPGALFEPHRDGSAVAGIDTDLDEVDAVLVTRERRGGATSPTEDPVIAVPL